MIIKKILIKTLITALWTVFFVCKEVFAFSIVYEEEIYLHPKEVAILYGNLSYPPDYKIKVKAKDDKFRQESHIEGGGTDVLLINGKGIYKFSLEGGEGLFIPRSAEQFHGERSDRQRIGYLNEPEKFIVSMQENHQVRLLGTEMLNGFECDVYEVISKKGLTAKYWLSKKRAYPPVKMEVFEPKIVSMARILKNIQLDVSIPDSEFEVPVEVRLHVLE